MLFLPTSGMDVIQPPHPVEAVTIPMDVATQGGPVEEVGEEPHADEPQRSVQFTIEGGDDIDDEIHRREYIKSIRLTPEQLVSYKDDAS